MLITDLISSTRDGSEVTRRDLYDFACGIASGEIPDYQASAWLMAVFIRGLSREATLGLTLAMRDSGKVISWHAGPVVADKHSTGGVGDKISLILAPMAAAAGLRVPMISGRSLGHTGGTLDKLESIPGMNVNITLERFVQLVEDNGLAMTGQTDDLAPADRKLYALRGATATVSSIPLMCASILSKKLAESPDVLVFDVKVGRGAFMKTMEQAAGLADNLTAIAREAGVKAEAVITGMDIPLGMKTGNSLEVMESIEVLKGSGPEDVRMLSIRLTASMLHLSDPEEYPDVNSASLRCEEIIDNGIALDRFNLMIDSQGGDLEAFESLPQAPRKLEVKARRTGFWNGVDALALGAVLRRLGGGRYTMEQKIDPAVGWEQLIPSGTEVRYGSTLGLIHMGTGNEVPEAAEELAGSMIWDRKVEPLIRNVI